MLGRLGVFASAICQHAPPSRLPTGRPRAVLSRFLGLLCRISGLDRVLYCLHDHDGQRVQIRGDVEAPRPRRGHLAHGRCQQVLSFFAKNDRPLFGPIGNRKTIDPPFGCRFLPYKERFSKTVYRFFWGLFFYLLPIRDGLRSVMRWSRSVGRRAAK